MIKKYRAKNKIIAGLLIFSLCFSVQVPAALADSAQVKPFIAFGANLTQSQKQTILDQFQLKEKELADYEIITVTNKEEHEYLDEYLDSSVIGTRALSSVKIEEADAGSGIEVEVHNISFCTKEMYTNALVTAGVSDANVVVAAPFNISGTAALVGAMKAYGAMTGDTIDEESADAANNELVVTGEIGQDIGQEEASELVALIKERVVSGDLDTEEEIKAAVEKAASELNISLTDEQKEKLTALMNKIKKLDINVDTLKEQADGIYNKLKELDIDMDKAEGLFAKIVEFFSGLFEKICNLFQN